MTQEQDGKTPNTFRKQVLRQIYSVRTREEVAAAWKARSAYLDQYPDDWEFLEIGAMLSRLEECLDAVEEEQKQPVAAETS